MNCLRLFTPAMDVSYGWPGLTHMDVAADGWTSCTGLLRAVASAKPLPSLISHFLFLGYCFVFITGLITSAPNAAFSFPRAFPTKAVASRSDWWRPTVFQLFLLTSPLTFSCWFAENILHFLLASLHLTHMFCNKSTTSEDTGSQSLTWFCFLYVGDKEELVGRFLQGGSERDRLYSYEILRSKEFKGSRLFQQQSTNTLALSDS